MTSGRKTCNGPRTGIILLATALLLLNTTISTPSLKTLGIGSDAPDFSLSDEQGKTRPLNELLGPKLTIVVFWASWSKKSEKALEQMQQLYENYHPKGLAVIGINVEQQKVTADIRALAQKTFAGLQLGYVNLLDRNLETFHDYGVIAVPTVVVLDPSAKIVFEMSGYPAVQAEELSQFVETAIQGRPRQVAATKMSGYQPDKKAARYCNLGIKALGSARTAASAEMYFQKAIAADELFILPRLRLAVLFRQAGKTDQAKEQLQKVLAVSPDNAQALTEMGLLELDTGDDNQAKSSFEQAIKSDEFYTPAYFYLGYLVGKDGDVTLAESLFSQAENNSPMDYRINDYRGKMYEEQNDIENAVKSYKRSLQLILGVQ